MEVLDLNLFLTFKNNEEAQELDQNTSDLLNELFGLDRNRRKKVNKNGVNILKNHKIQSKKDSIVNRVNLILNKLSESNITLLVTEFIENINQVTSEEFNEIQKTIYLKIVSEIHNTPAAANIQKVVLPGEQEWSRRRVSKDIGIVMPPDVLEKLMEAGSLTGISWSTGSNL